MNYLANFNQEKHCQKYPPRKKSLLSFWGGNLDLEDETDEVLPVDLPSLAYPLSQAKMGCSLSIVGFGQKSGVKKLLGMGLAPGMQIKVVSTQPSGSVIVAVGEERIGLGSEIANKIMVNDRFSDHSNIKVKEELMSTTSRTYLREIPVGTVGQVLGYEKAMGGYKGKLLSMGLTPKTQFTIIRVAPLGDPIEIEVRGFHLTLRKQEADALIVEIVKHQDT